MARKMSGRVRQVNRLGMDPACPRCMTLLVILSHPDDEVGCTGTIAAHRARGDRVVLLFLTRGEMTEALGPLTAEEVATRRVEHATEVARMLDIEVRFLEFQDTRVEVSAAAGYTVAAEVARVRPDAIVTGGEAWTRGMRHPDHMATGQIVRNAITLARIARVVAPEPPHRGMAPLFTLRDVHATLPEAAVDVTDQLDTIRGVAAFYRERVGWPNAAWLEDRLKSAGEAWEVGAAELFDAWESGGGLYASLSDPPQRGGR
jgi:N-acetylglucosamine malate deacetylase 1